jgi:hypothetical protein
MVIVAAVAALVVGCSSDPDGSNGGELEDAGGDVVDARADGAADAGEDVGGGLGEWYRVEDVVGFPSRVTYDEGPAVYQRLVALDFINSVAGGRYCAASLTGVALEVDLGSWSPATVSAEYVHEMDNGSTKLSEGVHSLNEREEGRLEADFERHLEITATDIEAPGKIVSFDLTATANEAPQQDILGPLFFRLADLQPCE